MERIVVIGAGILGASTAYSLSKKGAHVTVIDRHDIGQATDASAGMICPWLTQRRNKAWYELAKKGAAYYPSLIKSLEADGEFETGYQKVGGISLQSDDVKLKKMEERALTRRKEAPEIGDVRILTKEETSSLFPLLKDDYQSVYISGAARVDGKALRSALVNAARKNGVTFLNGAAKIEQTTNLQVIVQLSPSAGTFIADKLIITAGAWASALLESLGVNLRLHSQKGQIIHVKLNNHQTNDWPVVMPPNNLNILAFENGRIVIGATHEDHHDFDESITVGGMHELFDKALAVAPGLADAAFLEARFGFRPFTADFLPVFGALPTYENIYVANGLGASGLTVGPFLGEQLAKLVLGEPLDIDINNYNITKAIE